MKTENVYTYTTANNDDYVDIDLDGNRVASLSIVGSDLTREEVIKQAEFIVKACNGYSAVLGALKSTQIRLNEFVNFHDGMSDEDFEIISSIETDLNCSIENASK